MKKILLLLFLIATSMGIIKLSAYCFYNRSKKETISVFIYSSKEKSEIAPLFNKKASHILSPKGDKGCWNWKGIDKKNRKKQWYWIAYKGGKKLRTIWSDKLGEGYFPIGGAIVFTGYDNNARAKFYINYDNKPWKYRKSPWKHKSRPWKTYKRQ